MKEVPPVPPPAQPVRAVYPARVVAPPGLQSPVPQSKAIAEKQPPSPEAAELTQPEPVQAPSREGRAGLAKQSLAYLSPPPKATAVASVHET